MELVIVKSLRNILLIIAFAVYLELLIVGIPINAFLPKIDSILQKSHVKINSSAKVWLQISFPLLPQLKISDLDLTYGDKKKSKAILKAEHIHIVPSIAGIIFSDYSINYLKMSNSKVYLETIKEVTANEHNKSKKKKSTKQSVLDLDSLIKEFSLKDVSIFKTHADKKSLIHFDHAKYSGTFTDSKLSLQGLFHNSPIYLDANAVFTNDSIAFKSVLASYKKSKLHGDFFLDRDKNGYEVNSNINISVLNIDDFTSDEPSDSKVDILNTKLPLHRIEEFNFNINIDINKLLHDGHKIANINFSAKSDQTNNLRLRISSKDFIKGSMDNFLQIKSNHPHDITAKAEYKNLDLEEIMRIDDKNIDLSGGIVNVSSSIDTNGYTLKEIIANLDGSFLAEINGAEISSDINILSGSITQIIPFAKNKPMTKLECSVFNFSIQQGIMNSPHGIGLRTTEVDITGNGKINLNNGTIDFTIKPESRSLNIQLLNLAQLIKISGTISDPKITINAAGVIKEATSIVAGVLTGGIYTIAEGVGSTISKFSKDNTETPCSYAKSNK